MNMNQLRELWSSSTSKPHTDLESEMGRNSVATGRVLPNYNVSRQVGTHACYPKTSNRARGIQVKDPTMSTIVKESKRENSSDFDAWLVLSQEWNSSDFESFLQPLDNPDGSIRPKMDKIEDLTANFRPADIVTNLRESLAWRIRNTCTYEQVDKMNGVLDKIQAGLL